MYYILNWFNEILHILDKLSSIWVEFINNESIIDDRIWVLSHFFIFLKQKVQNLKNYKVKKLHTSQWYETVDENIIKSYTFISAC